MRGICMRAVFIAARFLYAQGIGNARYLQARGIYGLSNMHGHASLGVCRTGSSLRAMTIQAAFIGTGGAA